MKVEHELLLRATQPERFAQLEEAGELTAIQVMRANMEFFHYRAEEVLTTIIAMPLGDNVDATQLQGLQDFAGVIKMRELAQQCARDLARYKLTARWLPSPPGTPSALRLRLHARSAPRQVAAFLSVVGPQNAFKCAGP
jgi:hypothetical protein